MRRMSAAVAILGLLLVSLVSLAQHGYAQEATPVASAPPLVGSWFIYDSLQPQKLEGQGLFTFAADGTLTATFKDKSFSGGVGTWAAPEARTAQANLVAFASSTEYGVETWTFHLTITVAADGTLKIDTIFDNLMTNGEVDQNVVPGWQWVGIRITADPEQVVGPPTGTPGA